MDLKPLEDRVVVKPLEAEETSAGGIVIPDTAKEKPQRGKIVAVGEGKILDDGTRREMTVKQGDEILYGKYSGTEIDADGGKLLIMRESDLLAKIEPGAAGRQSSGAKKPTRKKR